MRCESCGYGVTRSDPPERCPMCGGADWEEDGWRPFSALLHDLRPRD
jgi:rubredoxin